MSAIHAIYENGVFRPLEPVNLPEGCRVELRILRLVSPRTENDMDGVYEVMDRRHNTGRTDLAERHNEHQP